MNITFHNTFHLVEGPGVVMSMIGAWLAERGAVLERNRALAAELGVERHSLNRETGVMNGVLFGSGQVPAGWRKPTRDGISCPKKGSEWEQRFKEQVGHGNVSNLIRDTLGIPTSMKCTGEGGSYKHMDIGHWFTPCQVATLGPNPPYLMVIPHVSFYVAKAEAEGWVVPPEVKAFKPEFDGCRQIAETDWEILCLQRKAAAKMEGES